MSRAVVDFPQPLSPTSPKIFPSGTAKEIWSTALRSLAPDEKRLRSPPLMSKYLVRFLTSSIRHRGNNRPPDSCRFLAPGPASLFCRFLLFWSSGDETYSQAVVRRGCRRLRESR